MISGSWTVLFTDAARRDFADILRESQTRYGAVQASRYQALILDAAGRLSDGPDAIGNRKHDHIGRGLRSRRLARRGRRSPHLLFFTKSAYTIEVVRILHDRMGYAHHFRSNPP